MKLISPEASWLTLDMLKDAVRPDAVNTPRLITEARPVAWKTGTSFAFRDAWTAAVFDHYVLVVWVGNFDGAENPAFVGRTAAAPLIFRMVDALRAREPGAGGDMFYADGGFEFAAGGFVRGVGDDRVAELPGQSEGVVHPGRLADCAVRCAPAGVDRQRDGAAVIRRAPDVARHGACGGVRILAVGLGEAFSRGGDASPGPPAVVEKRGPALIASAQDAAKGPCIVSPKKGLIYHLRVGAEADEVLNLEATAETSREELHWFVDATYLGVSARAQRCSGRWRPGSMSSARWTVRAARIRGRSW